MTNTQALDPIVLTVAADPRLARLVRMTAANVAALSSMSVDRVEDAHGRRGSVHLRLLG